MKRDNIFISENRTAKRVSVVKFVAPGDVPGFDCSIHFGEEGNDVTMQNCIIKNNLIVKCSPDDIYDFETGALIALMKMCGKDKVTKACDELYKDDNYKNALQEMTENNEKLIEENNYLKYVISCRESAIESLENTRDLLINKNNELREENEHLDEEKKHLEDKYERCQHILHARTKDIHRLEEENEKLKLDCEKLQHGYNDMIFCGGRQNGKQYTLLIDLFKKIDQKKVDAAYKEAYNTTLPVWQKEVLNQMYGVYKESKEKIELQGFHIEIKPSTKRKEMWDDILSCDCEHSKYVDVKKEDLEAFAKECNEKKIFNTIGYEIKPQEHWFNDDSCIFEIFCKPAGFICAHRVSFAPEDNIVDYLPPMRWDLFKKGRIYIRVKAEYFEEFKKACKAHLEKEPLSPFSYYSNGDVIVCYTDGHFRLTKTLNVLKKRPIVNWEDVR